MLEMFRSKTINGDGEEIDLGCVKLWRCLKCSVRRLARGNLRESMGLDGLGMVFDGRVMGRARALYRLFESRLRQHMNREG